MKKILAVLLALSMLLAMAACGGSAASGTAEPATDQAASASEPEPASEPAPAPTPEPTPEPDRRIGGYKLTGITADPGSNFDIVSAVVDMGALYYLFLKEDGTGSMNFLEAEIPLSWDDSSIIIQANRQDNNPNPVRIPFTFEDGLLKMSTKAYSMEFTPLTGKEQEYYEENGTGSLEGMVGKVVQKLIGGMDGGLVNGLLFDLALGLSADEEKPIPEGEPTSGTVNGIVDGVEFTILGADAFEHDGTDYIAIYYDATNRSDDLIGIWTYETAAAQNGEFLEEVWDLDSIVPEHFNPNYDIYPGRTIRCANVMAFDPNGGIVGFRISSYHDHDNSLLYYADPGDLSGAPAEPYFFDADPSVPAEYEALPEENELVRIENVEFFTQEDGSSAVRFCYRYLGLSEDETFSYHGSIFQDGIETRMIYDDPGFDYDKDSDDPGRLRARAGVLRTGSPVVFVVFDETTDTPIAAKVSEIG